MKILTLFAQLVSVSSIPIQSDKPVAIDYLNLGLAATGRDPVYRPPSPEIVFVDIPKPIGVGLDEGGCCISCGYNWCPSQTTCVRPWETYCQELDFPYNALYKGSGIIMPPQKK